MRAGRLIGLAALLGLAGCETGPAPDLRLLPRPASVVPAPGRLSLGPGSTLAVPPGDPGALAAARWLAEPSALYVALPAESLALAGAGPSAAMALTIDQASEWRARDMVGAMVQGEGSIYLLGSLGSGAKTAKALAAGLHPGSDALVRLAPSRLVWWKGWSSGSAPVG